MVKRFIQGPIITVIPKETKTKVYLLNKLASVWMGNGAMVEVPVKTLLGPANLNIKKLFKAWSNNSRRRNFSIDNFAKYLITYHNCCELKFKSHRFWRRKIDRDIVIF